MSKSKEEARKSRHRRIRKQVVGTKERPRLSIYRSLNHICAQIIDDSAGLTMVSASSLEGRMKENKEHKGNCRTAKEVGALMARKAQEKGIKKIVFDRSGYLYHGRIKALAEGARENGLEF